MCCLVSSPPARPSLPLRPPARLPLRHKVLRISGYLPLAGGREAVVPRCCTPRSVDRSRRSRKITLEENTGREVAGEIAFPENKRRVPLLALLLHPHLVCENTVKENRTVSRSQEYFQGEKKRSSPSSLLLLPLSSCCCSKPLCVCVCCWRPWFSSLPPPLLPSAAELPFKVGEKRQWRFDVGPRSLPREVRWNRCSSPSSSSLFFWGASPSPYSPLLARTVEVVVVPRTITCAVGTWMAE